MQVRSIAENSIQTKHVSHARNVSNPIADFRQPSQSGQIVVQQVFVFVDGKHHRIAAERALKMDEGNEHRIFVGEHSLQGAIEFEFLQRQTKAIAQRDQGDEEIAPAHKESRPSG